MSDTFDCPVIEGHRTRTAMKDESSYAKRVGSLATAELDMLHEIVRERILREELGISEQRIGIAVGGRRVQGAVPSSAGTGSPCSHGSGGL